MTLEEFKKLEIPDVPGIYFFKKKKTVLYVGKATSLKDRVRSYFSRDLMSMRGPLIVKMVEESDSILWQESTSVLEALILEAYNIKKLNPSYNSKEKDNKSYNYVAITKEEFPRILSVRGREILLGKDKKGNIDHAFSHVFGPFPHGGELREALRIVRKIFPFRDRCVPFNESKGLKKGRPCFNRQIGMCPGVCTGEMSKKEYAKTVRNIILFFEGKKSQIEKNFERDMKKHASLKQFEKAREVQDKLFALRHIRDITLLKRDVFGTVSSARTFRMEAYDIAHTSGKETVGVMVVSTDGELDRGAYRKFKIRGSDRVVDDTRHLSQLLERRLKHAEWPLPDLIVIDGGVAQRGVAQKVFKEKGLNIDIVSVVKDERHKPRDILGLERNISDRKNEIVLLNSEAHRFAISYHRSLLRKPFQRGKA